MFQPNGCNFIKIFYNKMNIAITGATGFIGKLLVEKHLNSNDTVHVLSRKSDLSFEKHNNLKIYKGGLEDDEVLKLFLTNVDVLYHCAAEIKNEAKMHKVNVEGTEKLIQYAKNNIKHWVQLSSVGVYGPIYEGSVIENHRYNPINEYEKTKLESDILVEKASRSNYFTSTFIRPSNVFGPTMSNQSLFQLVDKINQGVYFYIGKKGASANYVPVENVIEALYLAATHKSAINQTYIISNYQPLESFVNEIAKNLNRREPKIRVPLFPIKIVANLTGFIPKNPLTINRVKALSNRTKYLTDKIENELNYSDVISVENAITNFVAEYKTKENKKK